MRRLPLVALLLASCYAQAASKQVVQRLVASGGAIVYYIMKGLGECPEMTIEAKKGNKTEILLRSQNTDDPQAELSEFLNLALSPNGKTLFFETPAYATSNALHAIDLDTKKERTVTDGWLACVVLSGQYQGDIVVEQHKYFVQGGSYNSLYLYEPSGKYLGVVSLDANKERVCPTLGQ